jgi:hypothetical protein
VKREWKQIRVLPLIPTSIGWLSAFFEMTGKWNLISGKKSVALGLGSKNRRECGSSIYRSSVPVEDWTKAPKLVNKSLNHQTKGTFDIIRMAFLHL